MKHLFLIAAISLISLNGFSQSVSFTELLTLFESPYQEINPVLTASKKFKAYTQNNMSQDGGNTHLIFNYIKKKDTAKEETIITGAGFFQNDGSFIPNLYYKSKDSTNVIALQKQIEEASFALAHKKIEGELAIYNYTNEHIIAVVTLSKNKNYMIKLSRK